MKKRILITVVVITVVALAGMVISTIDGDKAGLASDAAGITTSAVNKGISRAESFFGNAFGYFGNVKELKEEKVELESRILVLESENRELEALRAENEQLRSLLDLKTRTTDYPTVSASVVATDPNGWFSYFIIDKGSADGLSKNNVVIAPQGVVGHIDTLGTTWSRVVTILEPGTACGAMTSRTSATGLVEGDSLLGGVCRMTYISKDANVVPGDYVQTSGSGDIYPSGLLIGRVTEISSDDLSQTAIVEPAVEMDKVKEVLVIPINFENLPYTE